MARIRSHPPTLSPRMARADRKKPQSDFFRDDYFAAAPHRADDASRTDNTRRADDASRRVPPPSELRPS